MAKKRAKGAGPASSSNSPTTAGATPTPPSKTDRPQATVVKAQEGAQRAFLASGADIVIYGGAAGGGKTWGLLLEPLRHVRYPGFGGIIFRRTYPEITQEGALWDQAGRLYPLLGGDPHVGRLEYHFPSGARVAFRHLQHAKSVHSYQGSEIAYLGFDELTHFEAGQFWYLLSRNRSTCGVRPYVRATCNPDPDSWVYQLIQWWIDPDTGYPIPERAGVLRWFVRVNDELVWADDPETLRRDHPGLPPTSLTFIPAKLEDNPALTEADPGYLARLLALPTVERERLLGGNWKVRPTGGLFRAGWLRYYDVRGDYWVLGDRPVHRRRCRRFVTTDLATSEKTTADYTVAAVWDYDGQGNLILVDLVRERMQGPDIVPLLVRLKAGYGVRYFTIPAHGMELVIVQDARRKGLTVKALRRRTDKVEHSLEAQVRAEAGQVWLPRAAPWLSAFVAELLAFPGGAFDDQVDVLSDACCEAGKSARGHRKKRPKLMASGGMPQV